MTLTDKLGEWGPMTVLMILVVTVAMGVGGAVVIVNPETLAFSEYLDNLKTFALAIAGLAGARGILGAGKHIADGNVQAAVLTPAPSPAQGGAPGAPVEPPDDLEDLDDDLADELDDADEALEALEDEPPREPGELLQGVERQP